LSDDDAAYRRSVRNMSLVLAAIVLVVFAAIFVPPLFIPPGKHFYTSSTVLSPYGFDLVLQINATQLKSGDHLQISAWANSTSSQILNVTAKDNWPLNQNGLWGRICTAGWPIGIGVIQGFYTNDNYTRGTLIPIPQPLCPVSSATPQYFLLEPHTTAAIASINGTLVHWTLQADLVFGGAGFGSGATRGVYTVVAADEWGDVTFLYFTMT
jgi:hypothetical protein